MIRPPTVKFTRTLETYCPVTCDLHRAQTGAFLTMRVLPAAGALSIFKPGAHYPEPTPLGKIIIEKLFDLERHFPGIVEISAYALMPDHPRRLCLAP